jgi:hypothetical protein
LINKRTEINYKNIFFRRKEKKKREGKDIREKE